jgi:hypothetical protein
MLQTGLTHPQILETLAAAGHGSLVLISDGNFPSLTAPYPGARRVYLNLRPGVVTVTEMQQPPPRRRTTANQFREDVRDAGYGDGFSVSRVSSTWHSSTLRKRSNSIRR